MMFPDLILRDLHMTTFLNSITFPPSSIALDFAFGL